MAGVSSPFWWLVPEFLKCCPCKQHHSGYRSRGETCLGLSWDKLSGCPWGHTMSNVSGETNEYMASLIPAGQGVDINRIAGWGGTPESSTQGGKSKVTSLPEAHRKASCRTCFSRIKMHLHMSLVHNVPSNPRAKILGHVRPHFKHIAEQAVVLRDHCSEHDAENSCNHFRIGKVCVGHSSCLQGLIRLS